MVVLKLCAICVLRVLFFGSRTEGFWDRRPTGSTWPYEFLSVLWGGQLISAAGRLAIMSYTSLF